VIRTPHMRLAKVLMVLSSLWMLLGCAQVATQSRPVPAERPADAEPRPSVRPEAPGQVEPPSPVTPESIGEAEAALVKPEPLFYLHVVRWQGETLPLIAQWYTASSDNWKQIKKANPGIDPNRITPGNRILIPTSVLKEPRPMPFDFLPPPPVSKKPSPSPTARIPPKKQEETPILEPAPTPGRSTLLPEGIELFGPREASAAPATIPAEMELFGPAEIAERPAAIPEETQLFGPVD